MATHNLELATRNLTISPNSPSVQIKVSKLINILTDDELLINLLIRCYT